MHQYHQNSKACACVILSIEINFNIKGAKVESHNSHDVGNDKEHIRIMTKIKILNNEARVR
jgi:hypothetical protein